MAPPDHDVRRGRGWRPGPAPLRGQPQRGKGGAVLGLRQGIPGPPKDLVQVLHTRKPRAQQVLGLPEQHQVSSNKYPLAINLHQNVQILLSFVTHT